VQHALAIAARAAVKFNDKKLAIDAGGLGSMSKLLMVEELWLSFGDDGRDSIRLNLQLKLTEFSRLQSAEVLL
jgi:hypothetical protein